MRPFLRWSVLLWGMLFSHAGSGIYAQVNTEALFRSSSSPFSLRAELSFGFNAGNSELFRWQASLRADYHTALFSTFVVGDIAQASADNQILLYRGFVHGRFIWHLDTTFHPEFFVQREFNEFILLKGRSLFGSGMRLMLLHLQPIDSVMSIRLTLGIGAMWENEIFAADNPETKLLRSTNYLSILWRLNARTSVQLIGYFQVDTRHWDDHRILIEGNLAVGITDKLILSIILNYRYDNEPVPTVRPFDIELRNALTLSF